MGLNAQENLLASSYGSAAVAAPGSGATITLWDSTANSSGSKFMSPYGVRYKRLVVTIYSSHVSAASGLQFDESTDGGANWRNIVSYTVAATTPTINYVSVGNHNIRVRYVNSANVLTTWEMSVVGDEYERASQ